MAWARTTRGLAVFENPFAFDTEPNIGPEGKHGSRDKKTDGHGQDVPLPQRLWIDEVRCLPRRRRQSRRRLRWRCHGGD